MQTRKLGLSAILTIAVVAPASGDRIVAASTAHDRGSCTEPPRASASRGPEARGAVVALSERLRPSPLLFGSLVTP